MPFTDGMELTSHHRRALAATLAGAAAIHVAMAPIHASEDRVLGALFTLTGAIQAMLALSVSTKATRRSLLATIGVSVAAVGAWAVSRTAGLPFGAHAGVAEEIGLVDLVSVGLQLGSALLGARFLLLPTLAPSRPLSAITPAFVAVLTVAVIANPATAEHGHDEAAAHHHDDEIALVAGDAPGEVPHEHEHEHAEATEATELVAASSDTTAPVAHEHSHDTTTPTVAVAGTTAATAAHEHALTAAPLPSSAPTTPTTAHAGHDHGTATTAPAPASPSTTPTTVHDHGATTTPPATGNDVAAPVHNHGECTTPVTAEQRAAADKLAADTIAGLHQFVDLDDAIAAGFKPITPMNLKLVHYANPAWYLDGRVLDPNRPESLMYAFPPVGDPILLGAMFLMTPGQPGPQVGGCLTQWHVHDNLCLADAGGAMVGVVGPDGTCPAGSHNKVTPEMLHVWGIDLPGGPFSEPSGSQIRDSLIAGSRIA
jgi:hypothetical protein